MNEVPLSVRETAAKTADINVNKQVIIYIFMISQMS